MRDLSLLRLSKKAGKPPGLVEYTGEYSIPSKADIIFYNENEFFTEHYDNLGDVAWGEKENLVVWYDVTGLSSAEAITDFCNRLGIHPLLQEDLSNNEQLPKMEDFEKHQFITLKMLRVDQEKQALVQEHLSLLIGTGKVISFQEKPGDVFTEIRYRLKNKIGKLRQRPADYLYLQLIDAVVDHYFSVFEFVRSNIEKLEFEMLEDNRRDFTNEIIKIRKDIIQLRKWVLPLREALNRIRKSESQWIETQWKHYLEDTSDQLDHISSFFDQFRDMLNYLVDLNFSNLTNETNAIVKTLTVISAIFIPLTFIAGVYGMNFTHMPELSHPNGYYYVLGAMGVIVILSLFAIKRKNWF